jgi:hypothetical protein
LSVAGETVSSVTNAGNGVPARLWAALLYAGEGTIPSHETAAKLTSLTDRQSALITSLFRMADGLSCRKG